MTAAAATLERSAGRVVPVPGAVSDGAPGQSPLGAPSHLAELKRERGELRQRLERLTEARAELEEPNRVLGEIEAEQQALEADTAGAIAAWASAGCEGQRPATNPERMAALARQKQATQQAIDANAEAVLELAKQQTAVRQQLTGIDEQISGEVAVVLAADLERELTDMQTKADYLNVAIGRVMGLRDFLFRPGGCYAATRLAQKFPDLRAPDVGATRSEIARAAAEWERRVEELTE